MATFDYARSRATAERLIARFGMAGTIVRMTKTGGTDYDPTMEPVPHPCQLVVLDYEDSKVDGTLIRKTDKMIYISTAGLTITLAESDKVIADGKEYAIEKLKLLSPAGLVVFYEVQGRQ